MWSGAMFVGVHERQLDDKGRLALPSAFRALLGDSCYLVFGEDRCVNVYARDEFERMAHDVMEQVRRNEMTLTRQRALAHSATLVTLDKQGRVTIDDKLRTLRPPRAELEGDRRPATSTGPRCGARSSTTASPRPGRGELAGGQE